MHVQDVVQITLKQICTTAKFVRLWIKQKRNRCRDLLWFLKCHRNNSHNRVLTGRKIKLHFACCGLIYFCQISGWRTSRQCPTRRKHQGRPRTHGMDSVAQTGSAGLMCPSQESITCFLHCYQFMLVSDSYIRHPQTNPTRAALCCECSFSFYSCKSSCLGCWAVLAEWLDWINKCGLVDEWTTAGVIGPSSPCDWSILPIWLVSSRHCEYHYTVLSMLGPTWPPELAWMVEAADWSVDQFGGGVSPSRASEIIGQSWANDGRSSGFWNTENTGHKFRCKSVSITALVVFHHRNNKLMLS